MENFETRIIQRYFRKTKATPEGGIFHDEGCDWWHIRHCSCGFLHALRVDFYKAMEMYPTFSAELEEHDEAREQLLLHGAYRKASRR